MQPFRLLRFRNRIELEPLLSLFINRLRTVLAIKGSLPPRRNGAPLTAPGRSEQDLPHRRERRAGKTYDPGANPHLRYYASRPLHSERGAACRNFSRLPARGGAFSLDILFYRTRRMVSSTLQNPQSARRERRYRLKPRSEYRGALLARRQGFPNDMLTPCLPT
jgi:hypothetical protein